MPPAKPEVFCLPRKLCKKCLTSLLGSVILTLQTELGKGVNVMNKEEILAKSRNDNKSADERQILLQQKAQAISGGVGLALCCIIALLEGVFGNSTVLFYGCFSIYWGIKATNSIVLTITAKSKYNRAVCILDVILFIGFTARLLETLVKGRS
jgi:hypothetical protein